MPMDHDRPRSFIERYVIARASHFTVGQEKEQAWTAAHDGRSVYRMIAGIAATAEPSNEPTAESYVAANHVIVIEPGQIRGAGAPSPLGSTGAYRVGPPA